jgi:hypothetical protein
MDSGCKRAVTVWHRRSGKDKTDLNYLIKRMSERIGQYYYYFPTMTQGRKILWDGIDKAGMRFMDHFPDDFIAGKPNNQEMKLNSVNGSLFQVVGTDRLEMVGPNPVGAVFSEFSLQNPRGWAYARPILTENGGWAIFNFTPRGRNHAYKLFRMAKDNPQWFCERLTVDDTKAVTQESIQADRDSGMTEGLIQQEYYCSFDYGMMGSYYSAVLNEIERDGHFKRSLFNRDNEVHIVLDPGYHTAIWLFQYYDPDVSVMRYHEDQGVGIDSYGALLRKWEQLHKYNYGKVYVPCDMDNNAQRVTRGETALEILREIGFDVVPLPRESSVVNEGIPRTGRFLKRCWVDYEMCEHGIDRLRLYHESQNEAMSSEENFVTRGTPAKDGNDHAADAMRYMSLAFELDLVASASYPQDHTGGEQRRRQTNNICYPGAIDDESDMWAVEEEEGAYTV